MSTPNSQDPQNEDNQQQNNKNTSEPPKSTTRGIVSVLTSLLLSGGMAGLTIFLLKHDAEDIWKRLERTEGTLTKTQATFDAHQADEKSSRDKLKIAIETLAANQRKSTQQLIQRLLAERSREQSEILELRESQLQLSAANTNLTSHLKEREQELADARAQLSQVQETQASLQTALASTKIDLQQDVRDFQDEALKASRKNQAETIRLEAKQIISSYFYNKHAVQPTSMLTPLTLGFLPRHAYSIPELKVNFSGGVLLVTGNVPEESDRTALKQNLSAIQGVNEVDVSRLQVRR